MRNVVFYGCALLLVLTACQKETSFEDLGTTGNTGNNNGTILTKTVTKSGTDSTISLFGYNASNKIISYKVSGISSGMDFSVETDIKRNAQGIIEEYVMKSDEFIQYGIASITTKVNYSTSANRYTSKVTSISFMGMQVSDSVEITYDANGKVTSEKDFIDDGITGYQPSTIITYTYNGNNLASSKVSMFDATTQTWEDMQTLSFEYDAKVNPMQFANEAVILGLTSFYSANNATKVIITFPDDPTMNETTTLSYNYNSANRPATATSTTNPGNAVAQSTYFYK